MTLVSILLDEACLREGACRFLMMADDLHEAYEVPCNGGADGKV
jgi:hypothetical protein